MALRNMADRDRRAILMGLGILVPALFFVFAVRPYRARLAETKEQVRAERALLSREMELLASGPSLPGRLKTAEVKVVQAEARLVRANNVPLAEAELTQAVEDMASASRVLLQEMRGVPPARGEEPPAGMRSIRLAVRGESDLEGVATLLHRIESSKLVLRLREISLEARPDEVRRTTTRGRPQPPPQIGVMQFAMVIEAYVPIRQGTEEMNP